MSQLPQTIKSLKIEVYINGDGDVWKVCNGEAEFDHCHSIEDRFGELYFCGLPVQALPGLPGVTEIQEERPKDSSPTAECEFSNLTLKPGDDAKIPYIMFLPEARILDGVEIGNDRPITEPSHAAELLFQETMNARDILGETG